MQDSDRFNSEPVLVWVCGLVHILQGAACALATEAVWVTSVATIHQYFPSPALTGFALMMVGLAAIYGSASNRITTPVGCIFICAQQAVLTLTAVGAIWAISTTSFADGVVRPWAFIFADQVVYVVLGVLHGYRMISFYTGVRWTRLLPG